MSVIGFGLLLSVRSFYRWYIRKTRKPFHFFLSHYKEEMGAFCRHVKTILSTASGIKGKVFVDSDDLTDLPMLFEYVASQTDIFVMVYSQGFVYRPWCMGEIVVARKNNVRSVRVIFPGTTPPDKAFIDQYDSIVPGVEKLYEYAISLNDVQDALTWIGSTESIPMPK